MPSIPIGSIRLTDVLGHDASRRAGAACGWAGGTDLPIPVAPFILCSASLFGTESVRSAMPIGETGDV